jgi:hypothetical protein
MKSGLKSFENLAMAKVASLGVGREELAAMLKSANNPTEVVKIAHLVQKTASVGDMVGKAFGTAANALGLGIFAAGAGLGGGALLMDKYLADQQDRIDQEKKITTRQQEIYKQLLKDYGIDGKKKEENPDEEKTT